MDMAHRYLLGDLHIQVLRLTLYWCEFLSFLRENIANLIVLAIIAWSHLSIKDTISENERLIQNSLVDIKNHLDEEINLWSRRREQEKQETDASIEALRDTIEETKQMNIDLNIFTQNWVQEKEKNELETGASMESLSEKIKNEGDKLVRVQKKLFNHISKTGVSIDNLRMQVKDTEEKLSRGQDTWRNVQKDLKLWGERLYDLQDINVSVERLSKQVKEVEDKFSRDQDTRRNHLSRTDVSIDILSKQVKDVEDKLSRAQDTWENVQEDLMLWENKFNHLQKTFLQLSDTIYERDQHRSSFAIVNTINGILGLVKNMFMGIGRVAKGVYNYIRGDDRIRLT